MSYLEKAREMNNMMAEGKVMEAFEKFYTNDVTVIEMPRNEVRNGKEAQRAAIGEWFNMVEAHHGGGLDAIASDETNAITMVESWMDVTMKGGFRVKMAEVAVQKWKGDQIVEEKFYYHDPKPQA